MVTITNNLSTICWVIAKTHKHKPSQFGLSKQKYIPKYKYKLNKNQFRKKEQNKTTKKKKQ
jgi:hypothetical protein